MIIALEAGTYSVTYMLPGFSTLVREQVEFSTRFTANLDAELTVGALEETATVTQAAPLADVQSIVQSEPIFCREVTDWQTNVSVFGSYTFPYDIDISAAFFFRSGPMREAIYQVPGADVLAALGRPATVPGSVSLNVLPPGKTYGNRMTQLDLRFAKVLDFGEAGNLRASFDLYNLFNGHAVSREQMAFLPGGGAADQYLRPFGMQPGRLAKVSFQYNF